MKNFFNRYQLYLVGLGLTLLFFLYTFALTDNPPGFYVDESAFAYNAYSIAKTGASEFGVRWPLFFQNFEPPFKNFVNPIHIYLLAAFFLFLPPSIWLARLLSALAIFEAGLLLGFLAFKISGKRTVAIIVGFTALVTPWFFEFGRWFSDASYYPLALALFLLALFSASLKDRWSWGSVSSIALTLALLTYTYTIGRMLAPMFALGLVCFITNKRRLVDVIKIWLAYGVTLIPFLVFYLRYPTALSSRFMILSYFRTETTLQGILVRFLTRYFQDLSLVGLLIKGDINPRHHVPGATGSILVATFILAIIGFVIVLLHHREKPWWRFILFGTFVSVIPGALTIDAFHTGRMIAYPIFLVVLSIPALEWLMEKVEKRSEAAATEQASGRSQIAGRAPVFTLRRAALVTLLLGTVVQATYFQIKFWRDGYDRPYAWDAPYKEVYDAAVQIPSRPIYLVDGYWGPGYIHALWYAAVEGRSTSEFVHLPYRATPPPGALVISSDVACTQCEILLDTGQYVLYRKL
ncbi:MAG TPA: glycosyltransferase family 39 protein [Pyrinomonadaceae bacterium]|nr:glycosyltransferase family 39 protein [Pyrinomonadaceae bacterium]